MSTDTILFNISAFIVGLFVLQWSADLFVDNTALLAKRLGVSEVLIALLTAGAEWEELAIVIVSLIQRHTGLAVGNVIGSTISNILGAFSVGLLFQSGTVVFDRSYNLYTAILLTVTTVVTLLSLFGALGKAAGWVLVSAFVVYIVLVFWSIYKGVLSAPEDSDSDEDSDPDSNSVSENGQDVINPSRDERDLGEGGVSESSALLAPGRRSKSIKSPLIKLLLGLIALSLSGYVLSHTSSTLAQSFGILDSVFGVTILSLATTLPEKFVAISSGSRGHHGILIANTVGSNIFLLTLCLGITLLAAGKVDASDLTPHELAWMWASSLVLWVTVQLGSHRAVGCLLLIAYIVFLVLEFTLYRR